MFDINDSCSGFLWCDTRDSQWEQAYVTYRASIAEAWQPQTWRESRENHPYSFFILVFHCETHQETQLTTLIVLYFFSSLVTLDLASSTKNITSQVTYVTMVPRVGNETLRPLGDTMGNASSVTRAWRNIWKNTIRWPATAHDVTTGATTI